MNRRRSKGETRSSVRPCSPWPTQRPWRRTSCSSRRSSGQAGKSPARARRWQGAVGPRLPLRLRGAGCCGAYEVGLSRLLPHTSSTLCNQVAALNVFRQELRRLTPPPSTRRASQPRTVVRKMLGASVGRPPALQLKDPPTSTDCSPSRSTTPPVGVGVRGAPKPATSSHKGPVRS